MKFTACKHLDYSDNYIAKKQVLGSGKVFWLRPVIDDSYPSMVQFCKKRGRLNNPESCTEKRYAACSCYDECMHDVENSSIPD